MERKNGYIVDLPYATLAPTEMSISAITMMARLFGHKLPDESKLSYMELGFGRGLSLNIAAASTGAKLSGVDFNPAHVDEAQSLADAGGLKVKLFGDSLAEIAAKGGKPDKDIIALHGVWSWVDDETRSAIAKIMKTRLKPGGVALISYNVSAGWSALQPMREFFMRYADAIEKAGSEKDAVKVMTSAIETMEAIAAAGGRYFQEAPAVAQHLKSMRGQGLRYLVHEYFNTGYRTSSFSELADALADTGLTYAGPARMGEQFQRQVSPALPDNPAFADPKVAETALEMMSAARFRSDLYIKGEAKGGALDEQRFTITGMADQPPQVSKELDARFIALLGKVWTALAADGVRPKTHAEIVAACEGAPAERVTLALTSLGARNVVAPCRDEGAADRTKACRALNMELAARTASSRESRALASPLIGGPVEVSALGQLFLLAEKEDAGDPVEFARTRINEGETPPSMAQKAERVDPDAIRKHYQWFEEVGRRRLVRLGVAEPLEVVEGA